MIVSAVSIVHVKIKLPHSLTFCYLDHHCQLRQILNPIRVQKSSHSCLHVMHVRC